MYALSVRQPWAWFLLQDGPAPYPKDFENRAWQDGYARAQMELCVPGSWFLLHASAKMTAEEFEGALSFARRIGCAKLPRREDLKLGGIVGMLLHRGLFRKSGSKWFEGPLGLKIADRYTLPFRPMKGQLGFFDAGDPYS